MKYVFRNQLFRLRFYLIPSATKRTKRLKRSNFFYSMGDNVHFQPRKLPADPKFIKIGSNVSVASGVVFVNHDIIHQVFSNLYKDKTFQSHLGCIEICDNVFIGSNTIIMPNVKVGPNAIIAAGSVVTKDVPEGSIVGGVPAVVIGKFDDLVNKRLKESESIVDFDRNKRIDKEWTHFYDLRKEKK